MTARPAPSFPARFSTDDARRLAHGTWSPRLVRSTRIELDGTSGAPGKARHAVELHLSLIEDAQLLDARLLVSELIANAILHGDPDSGVVLHLAAAATCVRVEVCDGGSGFAFSRRPRHEDALGGMGLRLVDTIASRWGVAGDECTCVWFELDLA